MSVYSSVKIKRPRRSKHMLTHTVDTTANIGQLIPTSRPIECVPGDTIDFSSIDTVDLMPLVRPFKGDLFLESWVFFVSNDMVKKPSDSGSFTEILASAADPRNLLSLPVFDNYSSSSSFFTLGKLPDYYGVPIGVGNNVSKLKLLRYPFRAYYKIWDEYFRDENLQTSVFDNNATGCHSSFDILNVCYKKDRFTSAFQSPQKGNPIRVPIVGQAKVNIYNNQAPDTAQPNATVHGPSSIEIGTGQTLSMTYDATAASSGQSELRADINSIGLDIRDLRLSNKLQEWEERLQLCGSRPKEFLLANYGIAPNDETLQRPVLIGHIKTPVIVDSVIQNIPTSDSAAASKTGNGTSIGATHYGKWLCKEFGWIIKLSALRPRSNYTQGVHRSLVKDSVYDFLNPIFENIGQQEIYNYEVFAQNTLDDKEVFGYTDRYNEYRKIESMTTGVLRKDSVSGGLESWVLHRKFAELPTLSDTFITVNQHEYDYLFELTESSAEVPQAIIHSVNIIPAVRPISKFPHNSL